jgi:hypothetical protein
LQHVPNGYERESNHQHAGANRHADGTMRQCVMLRVSLLWVLNNRGSEMIVEGYCS